ncbi:MAG TPA: hypothetical protein VGG86_01935 [Roseiarcus sp.]|jgi:hypothetical protein
MRASHIAVIAALFAIPTVGYAQQNGPVGGRVGADLNTSTTQPNALPPGRAYLPPPTLGHSAGYTGAVTPGQLVPDNVQVTPRPGGMGSAFIDGHRVLVDPSNRILRVIN